MINRKDQILEVAAELLQSRSFSAFSYKDITDRLGIAKPTIHHHFPTKAELGVALMEKYLNDTQATLHAIDLATDDPWKKLDRFFDWMATLVRSGNKICPTGILQAEYNVIPEAMQKQICHRSDYIFAWLANVLDLGGRLKVMRFPGKAKDQAAMIQAAVQGSLQHARVDGPSKFSTVVHQICEIMRA